MKKGPKNGDKLQLRVKKNDALFDRVAAILDRARTKVVQAVNSEMIIAYWLIGREIVQEIQAGDERAAYGKKILADLSEKLGVRYGKGFSVTNLRYFRLFYQTYAHRSPEIRHKVCDESSRMGTEPEKHHKPCDVLGDMHLAVEKSESIQGFSPILSWSHYRTLTKVENKNERLFYEIEEAIARYSVLKNGKQIFASKYMLYLPTEKELEEELKRERQKIEEKQSLGVGEDSNENQV